MLLSNLIPEFSSARQKHDVWTGPKMLYAIINSDSGFALLINIAFFYFLTEIEVFYMFKFNR